jgi:hypothetical protein
MTSLNHLSVTTRHSVLVQKGWRLNHIVCSQTLDEHVSCHQIVAMSNETRTLYMAEARRVAQPGNVVMETQYVSGARRQSITI